MTLEEWRRAKEVFDAAWELEPRARESYLAAACRGEDSVRAEVERMLAALAQNGDFLEDPLLFGAALLPAGEQAGRLVGRYRLVREIGRGGMGSVYLAVRADEIYDQEVAVKLVWPGPDAAGIEQRFRQERRILAALNHPNIARLLDGGATEDGWPYLVMEYVDGVPITQYCEDRKLSITERLKLFRSVCAAVAHAHQHLVIHRDLKPPNILVTEDGDIKLLDFGIAKLLTSETGAASGLLTRTGLHLLTPEYASPEQARGDEVTTASDVYSLGVLLYELLTSHRPYQFNSPAFGEIARVICEEEPERPSARMKTADQSLSRSLKGDLDQIALKSLRKEPEHRYQSAAQLSDDIQRHLDGEPVIARPATLRYRAAKFVKRHKAFAPAAAIFLLALTVGLIVALWQLRASREREREQRRELYVARLRQADEYWAAGDVARYQEALDKCVPKNGEEDLRGFEWRHLWRLGHREELTLRITAEFQGATFISGERLVTLSDDKAVRLWDAKTGRELSRWCCASALTYQVASEEGNLMTVEDEYTLKMRDSLTGQASLIITDSSSKITTFTRDGWRIFTGHDNGEIKLWDPATGRQIDALRGHRDAVTRIRIATDSRRGLQRMVTRVGKNIVQLWDLKTRRVISTFSERESRNLDYIVNGEWFWTLVDWKTVKFRDMATGRAIGSITEPDNEILTAGGQTQRGEQWFITGGKDRTMKLYDLSSFRRRAILAGHAEWVSSFDLSPGGNLLASGSHDRTIRLWDVATQRILSVLKGHTGEVRTVWFSHDGRQLISTSVDSVKLWDVAEALTPDSLIGHRGNVFSVAFSPDGRLLATASEDRTIKLWEVATGRLLATLEGHANQVFCVVFSPDGKLIASSGDDWTARLWDANSGKLLQTLSGRRGQIHSIAFSPDGKTLATGSDDRTIKLWDAATGRELRTLVGHGREVWSVAFAPDGRTLASGSVDRTIKLWDVATGRELTTLAGHTNWVWSVAFSRDGRRLLSGSADNTARLWDLATKQTLITFTGHTNEVFEAAFSPDEKRIATASNDHTIKLWNAETGQELFTLKGHADQVWSVAFSPDGQTLASGSWDRTARLWRAFNETRINQPDKKTSAGR
ncbi:MAG: protein kinase domain-containing protein [Blastocatellia bacterium]